MEEQLKALLGGIHAPQPKPHAQQQQAVSEADVFVSDDFRMYCYKVSVSERGPSIGIG